MNGQDEEMEAIEPESAAENLQEHSIVLENNNKKTDEEEEYNLEKIIDKVIDKELKNKFVTLNDGNVAYQYIFNIDNMSGNISSVKKEESASNAIVNNRKYKLYERQDCSDFVAEYKCSLHLACALATAMFEYVPVSDMQRLAESLLNRFEKFTKENDENDKEIRSNINPFISLDTILATIGAQTCQVTFTSAYEDITERCIAFEKMRDKIAENFWELFPMMRSEVIEWLIGTNFTDSYRNAFSISCFVKAMFNIVKNDFGDSINRLFPRLISQEKNKYIITRLMLLLAEDEGTKKNTYKILQRWADSPKWLWEISLTVFAVMDKELPFAETLEKTLTQKILDSINKGWGNWNTFFISGQMIKSLQLRNLIASIFNKLYLGPNNDEKIFLIANTYLLIICNAYQLLDEGNMALPLVAFDNKKQIEEIKNILYVIFSNYILRHSLLAVLEAYLKDMNTYKINQRLLNQLKSFFYVIAKKANRFNGDIQRFLSRLHSKHNKIAIEILVFLQENLPLTKEIVSI